MLLIKLDSNDSSDKNDALICIANILLNESDSLLQKMVEIGLIKKLMKKNKCSISV